MKVDIDTSDKLYADAWLGFKGTDWKTKLMSAILFNITIHLMKAMNLSRRSDACHHGIVGKVMEGIRIENATHAPLDFDTNIATTITAHDAGYINQPLEK